MCNVLSIRSSSFCFHVPDVLDSLTREGDRPRADAEVEADGPDRADRDRNVAAAGAVPAPVTGGVRACENVPFKVTLGLRLVLSAWASTAAFSSLLPNPDLYCVDPCHISCVSDPTGEFESACV